MSIYDRYLFNALLRAFLITLLGFFALMFVSMILDELKLIGTRDYGFGAALVYVLGQLPIRIVEMAPLVFLIAYLSAMG